VYYGEHGFGGGFDEWGELAETYFLYRSEFGAEEYQRIAKIHGGKHDDYTAAPGQRYNYFVRTVDENGNFADSNIVTGGVEFMETAIAEADNPGEMLKLLVNLGNKPQKTGSFSSEKAVIEVVGREFPIFQTGLRRNMSVDYAFYCTAGEAARLEELARSPKPLILRDWRYGTVFGTIADTLGKRPELNGGFAVNFAFTRTHYDMEVPLE